MATQPTPQAGGEPLITSNVAHEKAWKYVGYRGYSQVLASHEHFLHVRLFRTLNARVILAMQDHISVLEKNLDDIETKLSQKDTSDNVHNGSFRVETSKERFKLIWDLRKRLKDYNDYIISYSQLSARKDVDKRDTSSVRYWLEWWPNAIRDEETGYLDHEDDLIYVTEKTYGSIRREFRKLCFRLLPTFHRHPKLPKGLEFIMDNIEIESTQADKFLAWVLMVLALTMLIGPLWLLSIVSSTFAKLGVITGCIIVCLVAVTATTNAKASETLGATAA